MNSKPEAAPKPRRLLIGSLAGLALLFGATGFAPAQASEELIYTFKGGSDGANPGGALVADAKGALYGTTLNGGSFPNYGTVFKLTPPASSGGQWTENVLYRFKGGVDGWQPNGSLIFDKQGALYGATGNGGGKANAGTVFKLTPPATSGGQWTETVLYRFSGGADGDGPFGGLVFDQEGALYGATGFGGPQGGFVFKLTPPKSGQGPWTKTLLANLGQAGGQPSVGLIFDNQGALYGVGSGDILQSGAVFKLTPPTSGEGPWTKTVLYQFDGGPGGHAPSGGLVFDKRGALYGAATSIADASGFIGLGIVFKLTPPSSGKGLWTLTVLTDFAGTYIREPLCTLLFDAKGDLYGTNMMERTKFGSMAGGGSVFKLTPPPTSGDGKWTLTVLHGFSATGKGGRNPQGGLILGHDGTFYGTLIEGGSTASASGQGAVYRLQLP